MARIWKGPGVLSGAGKDVFPGEQIPDGHVTPERLEQLKNRIETPKEPKPKPSPVPIPKRKPGRPPKGDK